MNEAIQQLRRAVLTDGKLLGRFVERRDDKAFAALVRRHGPMVWGVCRRLLSQHDAEDAFQATFLVLVRKAASVVPRERVANWLYGVAHQTALQARRTAARRGAREKQVTDMPEPAVVEQDLWPDLRPLLDQELSRLPDAYREVVVLSDLEGKTRKEVARQLGLLEGTVGSRLARARTMLAKRLARPGLAVSGGALAAVLSQKVASAGVPSPVVDSTIKAASVLVAGQAAKGAVPAQVAALTEGVVRAMLFTKLKAVVAVVLLLGLMATGVTALASRTAAGQDDTNSTAEKPVGAAAKQQKERDREGFTAWGEAVGGLQGGLGFHPGQKRAYSHGETVRLVVRVRNVGKEVVNFQYLRQFFISTPPAVTDGEGQPVPLEPFPTAFGRHIPQKVVLAPGKEIELYELMFKLRPASEVGDYPRTKVGPEALAERLWGAGKVRVQYEQFARPDTDPILSKLATGKLELEIKPEPPPGATEKKRRLRTCFDSTCRKRVGHAETAVCVLLQVGPALVLHLPALARRNGDPLPALLRQQPGEAHDLADVVRGMRQGPMNRLEDGVLLPADRHLLQQVRLLKATEGLEKGGPPPLPGGQEAGPGVLWADDELGVPVPPRLVAVRGQEVRPA
jgi:RNA polymerase sigma factor (sigma-70 family)